MADNTMSLKTIAATRTSTVDQLLAGIRGVGGQAAWTSSFRAVIRKDDPPEED